MATTVIDLVWDSLRREIENIKSQVKVISTLTERSETAGGVSSKILADAPLAVDNAGPGDLLWISDGRKSGEGAGLGTGVLAYYNPSTDTWFRTSDDSAVTI